MEDNKTKGNKFGFICAHLSLASVLLIVSAFALTNLGNAILARQLEGTLAFFNYDFSKLEEGQYSKLELSQTPIKVEVTVLPQTLEEPAKVEVEQTTTPDPLETPLVEEDVGWWKWIWG